MWYKFIKYTLSGFLLVFLTPSSLLGQTGLHTYDTLSANELAQLLVGGGVIVSNVTINCDSAGYGSFDGSACNVGMNSGVLLTSGFRVNAEGPNDETGVTGNVNRAGDVDLNKAIPGYTTYDACVMEFDIFAIADTIKFNYVFGSDEYLEFVNSSFNDVFGFFISGPGITGPYSSPPAFPGGAINIALVPGTNIPVAINTVNNISNSAYYNVNGTGLTSPQNTDPYYIQYDGFTKVLTAVAVVQPCQTYHLKLAVADAGDHILDSGVFIEAGSLTSTGIQLEATTSVGNNYPYAVEGCNQGIFTFTRTKVDSTDLVVHFVIGGTAVNGTDYTWIPDSITIPANQSSANLIINPVIDGLAEPMERVLIYLVDPCFGNPIDSAWIDIIDFVQAQAPADTTICPFDTIQLTASGGVDYTWLPASSVSNDSITSPWLFPMITTTYTVGAGVAGCWAFDSFTVYVNPLPPVNAGPDIDLCIGSNSQVQATGATSYLWSPSFGLSDPNIPDPIAGPTVTTTYTLTGTDSIGCINFDSMTVFVHPLPVAGILQNDTTICPGEPFQLNATGGVFYSWTPGTFLNDSTLANPVAQINSPQVFSVTVTDSFGCQNGDWIVLTLHPNPSVIAGPDTAVCPGQSVQLFADNGVSYSWIPPGHLDNPSAQQPVTVIDTTTWFIVTITDLNGCHASDSVLITVYPPAQPDAGPDQSIYRGESAQFSATGGTSFIWAPPGSLDDPYIPDPLAHPVYTTTYTVTVTTDNGCTGKDSVTVFVDARPTIFIPNAFSPNGDGLNDVLHIVVLDDFSEIHSFRIYNRWGELVFSGTDKNQGWDGTFQGEPQEMGTYIYVVEGLAANGEPFVRKGNITLLR